MTEILDDLDIKPEYVQIITWVSTLPMLTSLGKDHRFDLSPERWSRIPLCR
jgi:hypothetical protein